MAKQLEHGKTSILATETMYIETSYADDLDNYKLDLTKIYTPQTDSENDACVVIVNQTTGPITLKKSDDPHGYWYSAPGVLNGDLTQLVKSPMGADGDLADSWIDAPPFDGYCTIGSFSVALHAIQITKVTEMSLELEVPGTDDHLHISMSYQVDDDITREMHLGYEMGFLPLKKGQTAKARAEGGRAGAGPVTFPNGRPKVLEDHASGGKVSARAMWFGPPAYSSGPPPIAPLFVCVRTT